MACIFTGMLVKFGGLALVTPSASMVMGGLMAVVLVGVQTRSATTPAHPDCPVYQL